MGLREQQNVLARLYTDPEFLRAFIAATQRTCIDSDLSPVEGAELAGISREELSNFSESLYRKRRREVEKMLPLVKRFLAVDFDPKFREFAAGFNPTATKKHLQDSLSFCKFLETSPDMSDLSKDAAKFERNRLSFLNSVNRFSFCVLGYDFRNVGGRPDRAEASRPLRRRSIAIWLRMRGRTHHFVS